MQSPPASPAVCPKTRSLPCGGIPDLHIQVTRSTSCFGRKDLTHLSFPKLELGSTDRPQPPSQPPEQDFCSWLPRQEAVSHPSPRWELSHGECQCVWGAGKLRLERVCPWLLKTAQSCGSPASEQFGHLPLGKRKAVRSSEAEVGAVCPLWAVMKPLSPSTAWGGVGQRFTSGDVPWAPRVWQEPKL